MTLLPLLSIKPYRPHSWVFTNISYQLFLTPVPEEVQLNKPPNHHCFIDPVRCQQELCGPGHEDDQADKEGDGCEQ